MFVSSPQSFADGSLHIWMADLNRLQCRLPELESHLSSAERERARQFHFDTDRTRFIVGRGHLREILSRCIGIVPAYLTIAYTPHGKPFLPDHGSWHFNVAHTQHQALYVVAYEREVGIDIELIRPEIQLETLAPRALCEREIQLLQQHTGDKLALFQQFWTLKEAFLKANGRGLSVPLPEIDVSNSNGQISLWDSQANNWYLSQEWCAQPLNSFPDCIAAIAARGQNWTVMRHDS